MTKGDNPMILSKPSKTPSPADKQAEKYRAGQEQAKIDYRKALRQIGQLLVDGSPAKNSPEFAPGTEAGKLLKAANSAVDLIQEILVRGF